MLTPRPAPTRESESFPRNRARGRRSIGIRNPTRARRRHAPCVPCRKPHKTLGINAKTPRGILSAFSVNWTGSESSLISKSSPGRTRTYDKAINSRLLYQLSYRGIVFQQIQRERYRITNLPSTIYGRKVAITSSRCKSHLTVFLFVIASGI